MVNDAYLVSDVNLTGMPPIVKRPSGQHHGDLRNALEEAALSLIAEAGPRGFTLAEASRRAGVSVAAPYKHYADRDSLLAALARRAYAEQARRFTAAMARADDPAGQLACFAAEYVAFAAEERALFEITFAAGLDKSSYPDLAQAGDEVLAILTAPAAQLRASPAEARDLVLTIAATAHGTAVFLLEGVFGPIPAATGPARRRAAAAARAITAAP
jgi:AcrR family transcriptional regulator